MASLEVDGGVAGGSGVSGVLLPVRGYYTTDTWQGERSECLPLQDHHRYTICSCSDRFTCNQFKTWNIEIDYKQICSEGVLYDKHGT